MKAKLAWTGWMLVLVPLTALGQLLPTRSIGVFGYQTLEPLGFNSSYSGIVDEWGSLPLPVMNLALSSTTINELSWNPTRSVLDGQYLLTGQVGIENASARKFEETGHATDSTQFSVLGNSTSLMGAQLESSGARESFTWQVSGQAGRQRLEALWDEFTPWGQPEFEVLGLYACASYQASNRIRISGRVAVNRSASMYTHFDLGEKRNLFGEDASRPVAFLIDSLVPPVMDTLYRFLPSGNGAIFWNFFEDTPLPFNALSQIERKQHTALKFECDVPNGSWSLLLKANSSRWQQRISTNSANVLQPVGLPNASASVSRRFNHESGWEQVRIGLGTSTRLTVLTYLLHTWQLAEFAPPTDRSAINHQVTLAGEAFRDFNQTTIQLSGSLDLTSMFGLLASGVAHVNFQPSKSFEGSITLGHGWREPSPFEHQWKSLFNADELRSQTESGAVTLLHSNFNFENATYAQFRFSLDFEEDNNTHIELTAPISIIHHQWNVDMRGVPLGRRFDYDSSIYGILLSREPSYLAGINAMASHAFVHGIQLKASFSKRAAMQQKGGQFTSEYNAPKHLISMSASKTWPNKKGRSFQAQTTAERIGPSLYSVDRMVFDTYETNFSENIEIENHWSPPYWNIGINLKMNWSPRWTSSIKVDYALIHWTNNPAVWYLRFDNLATSSGLEANYIRADVHPNFSTIYAPIVPIQIGLRILYTLS